jgi:hypothetical protein
VFAVGMLTGSGACLMRADLCTPIPLYFYLLAADLEVVVLITILDFYENFRLFREY